MDQRTERGIDMKHLYRLAVALIVLGFVVTAVCLMLAPDTVPVHFNAAGEADRMGIKYEYIAFPCIAAVSGAIFLLLAKQARARKWEGYKLTEKVFLLSAIGEVLLFNGMGAHFIWRAAAYTEGTAAPAMPAIDMMRVISLVMGVLLIVLGNAMPKARKNALYGVRNSWSMSSDEVWRKSQRFGGFASVVAGALLLAAAMFLKGIVNLLAETVTLVLWVVICFTASYRYYKKEKSDSLK